MTVSKEWASLCGYAAACLKIHLGAYSIGLQRPFRDVECVLCEDDRTVMLTVPAGDSWIQASFELPEKIAQEDFDPRPYLEGFEEE